MQCDGKRKVTTFVPLVEFTDEQLLRGVWFERERALRGNRARGGGYGYARCSDARDLRVDVWT